VPTLRIVDAELRTFAGAALSGAALRVYEAELRSFDNSFTVDTALRLYEAEFRKFPAAAPVAGPTLRMLEAELRTFGSYTVFDGFVMLDKLRGFVRKIWDGTQFRRKPLPGGPIVVDPPPPVDPTPGWTREDDRAFELLSSVEMLSRSSVTALHYVAFPNVGPLSIDDGGGPGDFIDLDQMPGGQYTVSTQYASTGGLCCDRPVYRPTRGPGWQALDAQQEIRWFVAAGIPVLFLDQPNPAITATNSGGVVKKMADAIVASGNVGKIAFAPMIDTGGNSAYSTATSATAAAGLKVWNDHAASWKRNGRFVIPCYNPRAHNPDWFDAITATLNGQGLQVEWIFCHVDQLNTVLPAIIGTGTSTVPQYKSETVAARYARVKDLTTQGTWGVANAGLYRGLATAGRDTAGKKYLGSARPTHIGRQAANGNWWNEGRGTLTFRTAWEQYIKGSGDPRDIPSMMQIPTNNDYSENAEIGPTRNHGWAFLDLNHYYMSWFAAKQKPLIYEWRTILSHKTQLTTGAYPHGMTFTWANGGAPTARQQFTNPMELYLGTTSTTITRPQDVIEAVVFVPDVDLTGIAVRITTGGVTTTLTRQQGLDYKGAAYDLPLERNALNAFTVPARLSSVTSTPIAADVTLNGVRIESSYIVSPWPLVNRAKVQDPSWRTGISGPGRGWSPSYPTTAYDANLVGV
jgi:hypothetical protein